MDCVITVLLVHAAHLRLALAGRTDGVALHKQHTSNSPPLPQCFADPHHEVPKFRFRQHLHDLVSSHQVDDLHFFGHLNEVEEPTV